MNESLQKMLERPKDSGPWWTPAKVRNQQQVDFIVMQANHFGPMSVAGRFLDECREAGVIVGKELRMREPGEDDE